MKRKIRSIIPAFMLLVAFACNLIVVQASEVMPLYIGIGTISTGLTISDTGRAVSDGKVILRSGYTADVTVELKQDGTTVKTWTSSGSMTVSAGGTYYVASGHLYIVKTTADVYDSEGNWVETQTGYSQAKHY